MNKVYIVSAKRSAVGSFLGSLKDTHPADLGAKVVEELLLDGNVNPNDVDELICGNVLSANLAQGIARQIAIKAKIPVEKCAYSLNMICGSGMKAVMNGVCSISNGDHEIIVAGGSECMSYAPMLLPKNVRTGSKMGDIKVVDHMIFDALTDAFDKIHMGVTAENIASKYNITRQQQDEFSINSQTKASFACKAGKFKSEIVPFDVKVKRDIISFDTDEYINHNTTLEKLAKLRPAFVKDGSVTAGNSSGINDGASFVLLASEAAVLKYNLKPMAEVIGYAQAGVDPKVMGLGPTGAIKKVLDKTNLTLKQMDLVELNEAFAAQSLGVIEELLHDHDIDKESLIAKTNVNGGAIAIGHPVGASGNRIIVTLLHEMKKQNSEYGLASLCIGGGMGTAVVVKNIK